ncbi:hypothetical protein PG993_010652 [Apiospora rasikravindrae]|uniref:Uncharacterized protein n=1 Tax=Apiospora rasikravindrae TaxID=990691 RepID=A0ABR1SMT4_9PEZI
MKTYSKKRVKRHRRPWAVQSTADRHGKLEIEDSQDDASDSPEHSDDGTNLIQNTHMDGSPRVPKFMSHKRRPFSSSIQDSQMDTHDTHDAEVDGQSGSEDTSEETEESDSDDFPDPSPQHPMHARPKEISKLHQKSQDTLDQCVNDPDLWKRIKQSEAFIKVEKDRFVSFKEQVAESMPQIRNKRSLFGEVASQADSVLRLVKEKPEELPPALIERLLQLNVYALGSLDWVRQLDDGAKRALFNDELEHERRKTGRTGPAAVPPPSLSPPQSTGGGIDFSQAAIMSKEEALFRQKYLECNVERRQLAEQLASATRQSEELQKQVTDLNKNVEQVQAGLDESEKARMELEKYSHELEGDVEQTRTLLCFSKKEAERLRGEISEKSDSHDEQKHEYDLVCSRYDREREAHEKTKKALRGENQNLSVEVQQMQFQTGEAEGKLQAEEAITKKLREQLKESRTMVASSSAAASKLRVEKLELESLETSLRQRIISLKSDVKVKSKENDIAHEMLKARDKMVKSSEQALSLAKSELLATMESLKAKQKTAEDDQRTIDELSNRISRGVTLLGTTRKELRDRDAALVETKRLADEQLASLREKNSVLVENLTDANRTVDNLNDQVNELNGFVEQLTGCQNEVIQLRHALHNREQELESVQSLADKHLSDVEDYKIQLANAQGTADERLQQLESVQAMGNQQSSEIERAIAELEELRPKAAESEDCKARLADVCIEKDWLKKSFNETTKRLQARLLELQEAQAQLRELLPRTEKLEVDTAVKARRILDLEKDSSERTDRETALRKQLEMAQQSASAIQTTIESDKADREQNLQNVQGQVARLQGALHQKDATISEIRGNLTLTKTAKTEAEKASAFTKAVLNTLETATSAWFEGRFGKLPVSNWKKFVMMWDPSRPAPSRGNSTMTETGNPWTVGAPWLTERVTEPPDYSCLRDRLARLYWLVLSQNRWDLGSMSIALELLASITKDMRRGTADGAAVAHTLRAVREPFLRKLSPAMHLRILAAFALRELAAIVGIEPAADEDLRGVDASTLRHRRGNRLLVVGDLGICKEEGDNFMVAIDFSKRVIWAVDVCHVRQIRNYPYSELVVESPDLRRGQDMVWHNPGMQYEMWWTMKLLPLPEININAMEPYVPLFS